MRKRFLLAALVVLAALVLVGKTWASPGTVSGTIPIDDFEGDLTWTVSGTSDDNTWQIVTDSIQVLEGGCPREAPNDINPDLVSFDPREMDAEGKVYLPQAFQGEGALWFGNATTDTVGFGSYLDDDLSLDLSRSECLDGGLSAKPYTGTVTSTPITLEDEISVEGLCLSFAGAWEIESVAPSAYDQMNVWIKTTRTEAEGMSSLILRAASRDGEATTQMVRASQTGWVKLGSLNPTSDPPGGRDNASYGYASGTGKGGIPQWVEYRFDLSDYIYPHQDNTLQIRFEFDTVDERYNGFRGWMIDQVELVVPIVSGRVWDCSGRPVEGATVTLSGADLSAKRASTPSSPRSCPRDTTTSWRRPTATSRATTTPTPARKASSRPSSTAQACSSTSPG